MSAADAAAGVGTMSGVPEPAAGSRTEAIRGAISKFTGRVLADAALADAFAPFAPAAVAAHNRAFANAALGCIDLYAPRRLGTAEHPFSLDGAQYDALVGHLAASFCEAGIEGGLAAALTTRLAPIRHYIVTG